MREVDIGLTRTCCMKVVTFIERSYHIGKEQYHGSQKDSNGT
jgi:hypothetical protein